MGEQELLDLARVDVLAAADDHVLDAADDVGVAVVVHHRQVAGVHPAGAVDRLGGLGRLAPVAQHDRVAAGAELTRHTARHDLAGLGVDDLDLQVRHHPADRAGAARQGVVGGGLGAGGRGLGHAVADADLGHVHAGGDLGHHLDRAG